MRFIMIGVCLFLLTGYTQPPRYTLNSPKGALAVTVSLSDQGQPRYQISNNGVAVLSPSSLGVVLDGIDYSRDLTWGSASRISEIRDEYRMKQGKRREITYTANEQTFTFEHSTGGQLKIVFRVSEDGVAFQYRFPGQSETVKVVDRELTSFAFAADAKGWLQPIAEAQTGWANTNPSYEEYYQMDIPVGTESPSSAGWAFPALFHTKGGWVLISEAGMSGNFHASRLQAKAPNGEYRIGYPMAPEIFTGGALKAQSSLPFSSPWRIVAVGDLGAIVNSTLGTDLADPAVDSEADWVSPGLASWSWVLLKDESVNYDTQKAFIDYAADMGWPYTLVDADWDRRIGYDRIAELAEYAAQKNVGLLLWYNSSGDWNKTEYSPKSALLTRESRRREFARLKAMGIKGVKIDFFAGDGQSMLAYYHDLIRDAADFGLLVNCHGSTLPRGLQRTYPNLMTMEAVRGLEFITFGQGAADKAPEHMAMLPYARNVFDPMDFTPTTFGDIPNIERRTRNGFELALPVLFLSGIQHIGETPEGMAQVPDYVKAYMRNVPAIWDESRFITGYPGKLAVIARRAGDTWYLAGINGEPIEKRLELDLSFLGEREGEVITDGDEPRQFARQAVKSGDAVAVSIKANGGFVMIFETGL